VKLTGEVSRGHRPAGSFDGGDQPGGPSGHDPDAGGLAGVSTLACWSTSQRGAPHCHPTGALPCSGRGGSIKPPRRITPWLGLSALFLSFGGLAGLWAYVSQLAPSYGVTPPCCR
jgi:hypothetical protein